MKFAPLMSVSEVLNQIREKSGEGGEDHGLFQPAHEAKRAARWLRPDRTLQFYDLRINVCYSLFSCSYTLVGRS